MPADDSRMIRIPLGQSAVDDRRLLAVDRGGHAVVMAHAVQVADTVLLHAQHFRVLLRHPGRTGACRSGQPGVNSISGEPVQHLIQPAEFEYAFLRLKH
ncbi:hypothetical protein D3C72_2291790 [compost metagenome]